MSTVSGGDTGPLSSWNNDALLLLKEKLKLKVLMNTGLLDKLERVAGGFMSEYEAERVRELPSNIAQVDKIIETLRGKGNKDFKTFCKMLCDSNQVVWADELKRVAEQFRRGEETSYCRRWTFNTVLIMLCSHLLLILSLLNIFHVQYRQCLGSTFMLITLVCDLDC